MNKPTPMLTAPDLLLLLLLAVVITLALYHSPEGGAALPRVWIPTVTEIRL